RDGLGGGGWMEGKNIEIVYRFAGGNVEKFLPFENDLVKRGVDVTPEGGTRAPSAAMTATTDIPIVMVATLDPVGTGLVRSLAKPGGNVTGLTWDAGLEIAGKRLELLK